MKVIVKFLQAVLLTTILFSWADAFGTRQAEFIYIGCFMDNVNETRDMPGLKNYGLTGIGSVSFTNHNDAVTSSQLTREVCAGLCAMSGFHYFGVQATDWCFCNNAYGLQGSAPESNCSQSCKGNASQICGGPYRNSVFQLTYLNSDMFRLGSKNLVALSNPAAPAFTTSSSVRSLIECLYLCDLPACQAIFFLKQQGLCHLLEFPALPSSLAAESTGEYFVRG